jgi:N utilization substance protein B
MRLRLRILVKYAHERFFDMTVTRRQAREWAIQMLTAADLNPPDDVAAFIAAFWEDAATFGEEEGGAWRVKGSLKRFVEERVTGVLTALDEIDALLAPLLEHWDLARLGTVERTVLRLGVWELTYTDIPPPVVINEAVDIVNWFSSPKSRSLVNGVLDRYAKARKAQA